MTHGDDGLAEKGQKQLDLHSPNQRRATASFPPGRAIMLRFLVRLRILKNCRCCWIGIAALVALGKPLELWWQDEARFGQKTEITRRLAKRGSRPSAPLDQRTKS